MSPSAHPLHIDSLPAGTHIGLNTSSFTVPTPFSGLLLPPALHLLWTSPPPHSLRHALFLLPPDAPTHLTFSATTESLTPTPTPPSPARTPLSPYTLRSPYTGAVTEHAHTQWCELTQHISPETLTRILGASWTTSSIAASADPCGDDDTQHLPAIPADAQEARLQLQRIDVKRSWPAGATGRERTVAARDKSWLLTTLVDVLGELEVCFLLAVYLGNVAAAEQWGRVVRVVLGCREAVRGEGVGFFEEFLEVLGRQVGVVLAGYSGEQGLEVEWVEAAVRRWWRGVCEEGVEGRVRAWEGFREAVAEWGWVVDEREMVKRGKVVLEDGEEVEVEVEGLEEMEERGEWAPVVVELPESLGGGVGEGEGKGEEVGKVVEDSDDDMPALEYEQPQDDDPRF